VIHAAARSSDAAQPVRPLDQIAGHLGGRADHDPLELADPLSEPLLVPVEPQLDVEVLAQELHARPADVLPDEHARARRAVACGAHRWIRSTTQSMHVVSASTSAGSMAGNMPTRSWLRPSLRYGSTSTIPLALSVAATAAASTLSSKSIVPTTSERLAASATNGVATGLLAAQR